MRSERDTFSSLRSSLSSLRDETISYLLKGQAAEVVDVLHLNGVHVSAGKCVGAQGLDRSSDAARGRVVTMLTLVFIYTLF